MNRFTPELPVVLCHSKGEMNQKMVTYMRDQGALGQRTSFSFSQDKSQARCHQTGQVFRILPNGEE